jgi:malonate-semialdehyde dehydrogenase (acetylating)/methylmalonate-semialdehyde dehydrogenase
VVTQKRAVRLGNFLAGKWVDSTAGDFLSVIDPATQAVLAEVPLSSAADVDAVVTAGCRCLS